MTLLDNFEHLRKLSRTTPLRSFQERYDDLERLEKALIKRKSEFARAISDDFGHRSKHETYAAEIFVSVNAIRYIKEHLREWMEVEPREVHWAFTPGLAEVRPQPLGVVGIIGPWNYPLQLIAIPLAFAIAAGNRAMLKPSEITERTSQLTAELVRETFSPDVATVVLGDLSVAREFGSLPFDHLFFTGSTRVGKEIMKAAAENLTPVTLELGGKSPAILGQDASIGVSAKRIANGKLLNAGQTCIAPDYVLLHKDKRDAFVAAFIAEAAKLYPKFGPNPDYSSIVNEQHFDRLTSYVTDARDRGAKIIELNQAKEELPKSARKFLPTLILDAPEDSLVMKDEIFGPILPIQSVSSLEDAVQFVNDRPRPLALYYFGHRQSDIQYVLDRTVSGGVAINETLLQIAQDDLPFGGVGPSGVGHYHGHEGFLTFSKLKPVFYQSRVNFTELFRPPYGKTINAGLRFFIGK